MLTREKWDDIQNRLREIDRLKSEFQKASEWNRFSKIQIKNLQSIVEAQNELLTRAADALEYATESPKVWCNFNKLIAELRKAAE